MISFKWAKTYCKDSISLIENYDKAMIDKEQIWHCHHRRELEISKKELIKNDEYYNRPANELIFLTKSEHNALHNTLKFKGKHHTEEAKRKMSLAKYGKKRKPFSEEAKHKMSLVRQNRHWWNNGIKAVWTEECPEGFVKGRLKKSI